jgi:hypothetical protein
MTAHVKLPDTHSDRLPTTWIPRQIPVSTCWDLLADPSWVYSQYDHQLFLNTVVGPGDDATVLRLKHPTTGFDTGRGLALTTDGNHRWCACRPPTGNGPGGL